MASKSKEARLEQKACWDEKLNRRISLLVENGVKPEKIAKDTTVRGLRANRRETNKRLKAIEGLEKKLVDMAKTKAEKLAAPKMKKTKKKNEGEQPAAQSKRQQKKKKKEGKGKD